MLSAGGHIKGSQHFPACEFDDAAIKKLRGQNPSATTFVFHCMHSQVRGPKCARRMAKWLENEGTSGAVAVLEGGFVGWMRAYGSDQSVTFRS